MSGKTVEAYERDVRQFLGFMAEHCGGAPSLRELARLTPQDVRAFMAARRAEGTSGRSLMRGACRRALVCAIPGEERQGQGRRARRGARAESTEDIAEAARDRLGAAHRGCRPARRRRSRAMGAGARRRCAGAALRQRAAHLRSARHQTGRSACAGQGRRHHRHRQGQQTAHGPGAATGRAAHRRLCRDLPLRSARRRTAVRRRQRRAAVAAHPATDHGAAARRARPARTRRRRTPCGIRSPRICWRAAAICAPSRSFSATPRCPPPRSIRRWIPSACSRSIAAPIRGHDSEKWGPVFGKDHAPAQVRDRVPPGRRRHCHSIATIRR